MDPVTAFGLSASVMQFVGFASGLISKTREIHASASGSTRQVATLETVYGELSRFSAELGLASQLDAQLAAQVDSHVPTQALAITELARVCKEDCDRLLDIVQSLKGGSVTKRHWQSFRLALKTVWKGNEIADLEQRLHHTQMTLTLQVNGLTSFWQSLYQQQLKHLLKESVLLESERSAKLDAMAQTLHELSSRIAVAAQTAEKPLIADDLVFIQSKMSQLSVSTTDVAREHCILRSFAFDSLPARHNAIREAHRETFQWVFKENSHFPNTQTATGDLIAWLKHGKGTFWISGKPGSGKSTLMKFVADHDSTVQALTAWSSPKPPIIACHYFWSAGTSMQKSLQGLLQTLLHDIFRQQPDLMELACAGRWSESPEALMYKPWTVPELHRILQHIGDRGSLRVKMCFFIDGLDEYEGDHVDFCTILKDLSASPSLKLCISSRPWNVFEDSFGRATSSKLYIHELTRGDIRSYARRRLQEHPRWQYLEVPPEHRTWLVDQITERAAGVFLWVFLVTKELRSGLTEYDSFSDLERRLEAIPTDLEVFFRQILESVEPFYHGKMATTLLMALAARKSASVELYAFQDLEHEDQHYALKMPLRPLGDDEASARQERVSRQLAGRCRGLLEVNSTTRRVEFLHRTVVDFLRTNDMTNFLREKSARGFDASLVLLKAYVACIKTTRYYGTISRMGFAKHRLQSSELSCPHQTSQMLMESVQEALTHASEAGPTSDVLDLVGELERCIPQMHNDGQATLQPWANSPTPTYLFFREPMIKAGLVEYVHRVFPAQPDYFSGFGKPIISHVVTLFSQNLSAQERDKQMEILRYLLEHGCDPNEGHLIRGSARTLTTPWKELLGKLTKDKIEHYTAFRSGVLPLLLKHGAHVNRVFAVDWLKSSFLASCVHTTWQPASQVLFLQTLDGFVAAGLDFSELGCCHLVSDFIAQLSMPALQLTSSALGLATSAHPSDDVVAERRPFQATVLEKLLNAEKAQGITRKYSSVASLRDVFPTRIYRGIVARLGVDLDGESRSPVHETTLKRRPGEVEVESDERRAKMARSASAPDAVVGMKLGADLPVLDCRVREMEGQTAA